jgi:hypothetical protein
MQARERAYLSEQFLWRPAARKGHAVSNRRILKRGNLWVATGFFGVGLCTALVQTAIPCGFLEGGSLLSRCFRPCASTFGMVKLLNLSADSRSDVFWNAKTRCKLGCWQRIPPGLISVDTPE